jgi:hypothetical protein
MDTMLTDNVAEASEQMTSIALDESGGSDLVCRVVFLARCTCIFGFLRSRSSFENISTLLGLPAPCLDFWIESADHEVNKPPGRPVKSVRY